MPVAYPFGALSICAASGAEVGGTDVVAGAGKASDAGEGGADADASSGAREAAAIESGRLTGG